MTILSTPELDCLMLLSELDYDQEIIDLIWMDSQDLTELNIPPQDEKRN
jgi:hypothetical protein